MKRNEDWWFAKILAFLHDPPHKPLVLGQGHERIGMDLARSWLGGTDVSCDHALVRLADQVASGADRERFLRDVAVDPRRDLTLVHPLDGNPLTQVFGEDGDGAGVRVEGLRLSPEDARCAHESMCEAFDAVGRWLEAAGADSRLRFVLLWRLLPELLRVHEQQTGSSHPMAALWERLPADTRMPTHTVLGHCGLVSALASVLNGERRAAVLTFSIGPVQGFIASSRRLSDLWASSSLLSHSMWAAIREVCSTLGPDHVIFPSLREQPLLDDWLLRNVEEGGLGLSSLSEHDACPPIAREAIDGLKRSLNWRLRIPSLPNRFAAVVPAEQASAMAGACEHAVRRFWADAARGAVEALFPAMETPAQVHAGALAQALRQVDDLLEVVWASAPWDAGKTDLQVSALPPTTPLGARWRVREALEASADLPGYAPNGGLLYGDSFAESQRLLDASKRSRASVASPEHGLKCSLCGEREVLGPVSGQVGEGRVRERKQIWGAVADQMKKRSLLRDGELLCGPCWVKRWWGIEMPDGGDGAGSRHPSTGEVAAARFKLDVVRGCARAGDARLQDAVERFVQAANAAAGAGALDRGDVHVWCPRALLDAAGDSNILKAFAHVDGQYVLPAPRGARDEGVQGRAELAGLARAAASLRRAASTGTATRVQGPRAYLAVVHFDGDCIGKWLDGEIGPTALSMLHEKVRAALPPQAKERLGRVKRRVTPAVHHALSDACATFSQKAVPMTVELEGIPAHLVYAGGDDALVFAPLADVVELVRRMRLRFSGYPWPFESGDEQRASSGHGYCVWESGHFGRPRPPGRGAKQVGLVFGHLATASAGLCVFHYTAPLGEAIEQARAAEAYAKHDLGRNALGLTILRRSGQVTRTGLRFFDAGGQTDYLAAFLRLQELFSTTLSARLVRDLYGTVGMLVPSGEADAVPDDARWKMAIQLAHRSLTRRTTISMDDRRDLRQRLEQLADACSRPHGGPSGVVRWLGLVEAAAFFSRTGED